MYSRLPECVKTPTLLILRFSSVCKTVSLDNQTPFPFGIEPVSLNSYIST